MIRNSRNKANSAAMPTVSPLPAKRLGSESRHEADHAQKSEIPNENNGQQRANKTIPAGNQFREILVGIYLLNLQRDFRGGLVYLNRHGMAIRQNCLLWISDNRGRSRRPSLPALEFIFVYECSTSGAPWKSHFGRTSDGLLSASRLAHEPLIREAMPHSCGIALRANWLFALRPVASDRYPGYTGYGSWPARSQDCRSAEDGIHGSFARHRFQAPEARAASARSLRPATPQQITLPRSES